MKKLILLIALISSCKSDKKFVQCVHETIDVFDYINESQAENIVDFCEKTTKVLK